MHYYNSNIEGFVPQSFQPVPWGWYGIPIPEGKTITDVMQKVEIPDLSESLDEMNFILAMMEKASGATATQQGVQTQRNITLGEVQLALGEAKERIKGMSKFYTPAWKQRGTIFIKLVEAAANKLDAVKIYKKGRNTSDIYTREISPKDWQSVSGYQCKVWSQDEKDTENSDALQKLNAAKMIMVDNPKLNEVYQRKLLEFARLNPDDINEIMKFEEEKMKAMVSMASGMQMPPAAPQAPQSPITAPVAPPMKPAPKKTNKSAVAVGKLKSIRSNINKL